MASQHITKFKPYLFEATKLDKHPRRGKKNRGKLLQIANQANALTSWSAFVSAAVAAASEVEEEAAAAAVAATKT